MNAIRTARLPALTLVALGALLCSRATADDLYPPPWRGLPGTQTAVWDTWFDFPGTVSPEEWTVNPVGLTAPFAELIPETEFFGEYAGRQDVLRIPYVSNVRPSITFQLDDYDRAGPFKVIRMQFTWYEGVPSNGVLVENINVWPDGTGPLQPAYTTERYYDLETGWVVQAVEFTFKPNPDWERIQVDLFPVAAHEVYLDQVVVDTWCVPEPAAAGLLAVGCVGFLLGRRRCAASALVVLLAFVVCGLTAAPARAQSTAFSVEPSWGTVEPNDVFSVDLVVEYWNTPGLYGWSTDVLWDSSVIELLGYTEGPFLTSGGGPSALIAGSVSPGQIDNLTDSLLGQTPGVTGMGVVATLTFEAVSQSAGYSPITLDLPVPAAVDSDGNPLSAVAEHGGVEVVPEPGTLGLLTFGGLTLLFLRPRKRQRFAITFPWPTACHGTHPHERRRLMNDKNILSMLAAVTLLVGMTTDLWAGFIPLPADLEPGDQYQLVFVTGAVRDATSGDISDYNDFVQAAADAAGIGTTVDLGWRAIGSTRDDNARNNAPVSAPVYRLDSVLVATGFDDLWDGTILVPINVTETGHTVGDEEDQFVWTGSGYDGNVSGSFPLGNGGAQTDRVDTTDFGWIQSSAQSYTNEYRVYALSEPITAVPEPASVVLMSLGLLCAAAWWRHMHIRSHQS